MLLDRQSGKSLAKINSEQILSKAKLLFKKGRTSEAQALYEQVLNAFPKNVRAKQAIENLKNVKKKYGDQNPPSGIMKELMHLFNNGLFSDVIDKTQILTNQYPNAFILWNILGASAYQRHMPYEAIKAYKKAILIKPDYAAAYNNMGVVLKDIGKIDEAMQLFNKAILINPDYEEAYNNLGNVFNELGRFKEAIDSINKSISLKPNYVLAYNNLGIVLAAQGKLDGAIEAFQKAVLIKPDFADAYNNMANVLKDQNKFQKAIDAFKKAILFNPNYAVAYNNLGKLFNDQGKFEYAVDAFKKAILIKFDYAEAYNNKDITLRYQGKFHEAIDAIKKAILIKPEYANAYNNLGNLLKDQGNLDDAIDAFNKALSINPDYAAAYSNMGVTIKNKGKLDYAIKIFKKSISLNPNDGITHKNLSFALLNKGKLKEGLDEYEWRWKTPDFLTKKRHFLKPLWDGNQSLDGKRLFLWCEQGIGDTINWSSVLSHLSSQNQDCILECQEKLVPLLDRSFPKVIVEPENRSLDLERDDFDFHLPMGSLYKHFYDKIKNKLSFKPYLIPNPDRVNFWKKRLKSLGIGPYIGISWKSSNKSPERLPDYTSISEWLPILKVPKVKFINMQYKDYGDDIIKIKDKLGVTIHNFEDINHFDNIDDVAALSLALDMVVSTKLTVPFISAGVGTSTKLAIWRQSSSNNVLLNPLSSLVEKYERNTWDSWDNVFNSIAEDILKLNKKMRN